MNHLLVFQTYTVARASQQVYITVTKFGQSLNRHRHLNTTMFIWVSVTAQICPRSGVFKW